MLVESDIRAKLLAVSSGTLAVNEFERWMDSASWDMHRDSHRVSIDLVHAIHHLMDEHDDQVIDDAAYLEAIRALLGNATVEIEVSSAGLRHSSVAELLKTVLTSSNSSKDISGHLPAVA